MSSRALNGLNLTPLYTAIFEPKKRGFKKPFLLKNRYDSFRTKTEPINRFIFQLERMRVKNYIRRLNINLFFSFERLVLYPFVNRAQGVTDGRPPEVFPCPPP